MAGGVPVGTLSIQIVAELARLQQDMERTKKLVGDMSNSVGRSARAANDNLAGIGRGAGAGLQEFSRDVMRLKASIDPAFAALQKYKAEVRLLQQALREGAITHKQYVDQMRLAVATYKDAGSRLAQATGVQRAGMQQLSFQIGDVAQQFALGTNPMVIFAQQGGQVVQAISLMKGEAKGLIGFLAGPWGAVFMGAAMIAGTLISRMGEGEKASLKLGDALDFSRMSTNELIDAINELEKAQRKQIETGYQAEVQAYRSARAALKETQANIARTKSLLNAASIGARSGEPGSEGISAAMPLVEKQLADLVESEKKAAKLLRESEIPGQMRAAAAATDAASAATLKYDKALARLQERRTSGAISRGDFQKQLEQIMSTRDAELEAARKRTRKDRSEERRLERLAREADAVTETTSALFDLAAAYGVSDEAALRAEARANAVGQAIKKQGDIAAFVSRELEKLVAQRAADAASMAADLRSQTSAQRRYNDAVTAGSLTSAEAQDMMRDELALRPFLAAMAVAEGKAKKDLADIIDQLRKAQAASNLEAERSQSLAIAEQNRKATDLIEKEMELTERLGIRRIAALKGLRGQALEDELAAINVEHQKASILLRAQAEAADYLRRGMNEAASAVLRKAEVEAQGIGLEHRLNREADAAARLADEINRIIGAISGMGAIGNAIGSLLGFFSGETGSVGGPIGELLNMAVGTKKDASGRTIARTLGDELRDVFKLSGEFGKTMTTILQGAGNGMIAGQAFFGNQSSSGQLGSAIGGALGEKLGEKFLSKGLESIAKGLGDFAGPLGSIIGGVLGGALGGMLTKVKWGRVDLTAQGVSGAVGNDGASERAAVKAGGSFFDALQGIAEQFNGRVGDFGSIALGVRHGDWRVNTTGTSLKVKRGAIDFNDDAEAAIAFALQEAIDRGAITGIRAGTQKLLKSSDDLQKNLEKALKFENVFKELAQLKDPLGFELSELAKEFDRLRDIFAEAGASAEEYAQLEELLARKRADVIEQDSRRAIEDLSDRNGLEVELLRLLGREEDAVAVARLAELAGLKASLQPLQTMVYQLQDARAIMDKFGPLADDLKAFRAELLGGGSTNGSFAFLSRQFRDTAALAKGGDATALGSLRGTASAFLDAAKENASSALDYQRAVGEVLASVDQGIFAADSQIEYAQMQIDAINNSANILQSMKDEMATYQRAIADNTEWLRRQWSRLEGDGLRIKTDEDTPIQVEVVS